MISRQTRACFVTHTAPVSDPPCRGPALSDRLIRSDFTSNPAHRIVHLEELRVTSTLNDAAGIINLEALLFMEYIVV